MKVLLLFTGSSPLVVMTSHASATDPGLVEKLQAKGIGKFIAYEIPLEIAKARYGGHFAVVKNDLSESDDLRILDYNGERAFRLFRLDELGAPITHDPEPPESRPPNSADDTN
jgi:hypothetical protein